MLTTEKEEEQEEKSYSERAFGELQSRTVQSERVQKEVEDRYRDVFIKAGIAVVIGTGMIFGGLFAVTVGALIGSTPVILLGVLLWIGVAGGAWYVHRQYRDEIGQAISFAKKWRR